MDLFEPYKNIIGFTSIDCTSQQTGRPVDYNVSKSGLFLNDIAEINKAVNFDNCGASFWEALESCRKVAIEQFVGDTNALMAKLYRPRRKQESDLVLGETKSKDVYDNNFKNYAVIRYACAPIRGGYMRVNAVGGAFDQDGENITVIVYDSLGNTHGSYTFTTQRNAHVIDDTTVLELPMFSKYCETLEYYFVYIHNVNSMARDTKLVCGCGSWVPKFDLRTPYNQMGIKKPVNWANYVMVGGVDIDSVDELNYLGEDVPTADNNMRGLTVDVDFFCMPSEIVSNLDYAANPLALSTAIAIKYKTAVLFAQKLLSGDDLELPNLVHSEDWETFGAEWQEKYNEQTNYVAANLDLTANDCLRCKDVIELTKVGAFS